MDDATTWALGVALAGLFLGIMAWWFQRQLGQEIAEATRRQQAMLDLQWIMAADAPEEE